MRSRQERGAEKLQFPGKRQSAKPGRGLALHTVKPDGNAEITACINGW